MFCSSPTVGWDVVLFRLRRFWSCEWVPFFCCFRKGKICCALLLSTFFSVKGKEKKMDRSFPRLSPTGDKRTPASEPLQPPARMPATTPLRPPCNSDTGSSGDRRWPKMPAVEMVTCTCAGPHQEWLHHGCEGQVSVEERDTRWRRNANNKKKNWYCPYCWATCLAELGGGQVAEEQRERKKVPWTEEWTSMGPWESHWNFELDQIDFWAEVVPCSNCAYVGTRGQMYVGKKINTMWCARCDEKNAMYTQYCFVDFAAGKYDNVPKFYFWRWIDWLHLREVDEREYGPGLGTDEYALGPDWRFEVFEKTENAASQKCLGKSAK